MSSERPTLAELADELEAEKPCGGYTAANAIALSPDTVALLAARLREADEALVAAERVLCGWEHVEDSAEERDALAKVRRALTGGGHE